MRKPFCPTGNSHRFMLAARYLVADDIRYREIEGCGVILDIRSQQYRVLNEVGTQIWAFVTAGGDIRNCVRQFTAEFDVAASEVERTIDTFCADCLRKGLLRLWQAEGAALDCRQSRPPVVHRYIPGALLAFWALASTALSLKLRGFARTYGQRRGVPAARPLRAPVCLESIVGAFLFAENFAFFSSAPNDCLMRSLALFHYLRRRGIPAVHVIGVRRVPFFAHAWVEVSGEGVLAPRPRGFAVLATLVAS